MAQERGEGVGRKEETKVRAVLPCSLLNAAAMKTSQQVRLTAPASRAQSPGSSKWFQAEGTAWGRELLTACCKFAEVNAILTYQGCFLTIRSGSSVCWCTTFQGSVPA
ncbi:hypothetical protein LEMLEM_LOCUS18874 [Lemmus lemmus]